MNWIKAHKYKMQFVHIKIIACCLAYLVDNTQAQHVDDARAFVNPSIDYSPWSPVDAIDYPLDTKINKVRSILSSPPEIVTNIRNNKFSPVNVKIATRRNFESTNEEQKIESPPSSTVRPAYKRRTTSSPSTTIKTTVESAAGRFRAPSRRPENAAITAKPRRQFTPRTTSENVVATTSESSSTARVTFKKPTRGTYRPKTTGKSNANDDGNDGENYPEHFKAQLLKSKEVITQQSDKSVLKKPLKVFRPTSTDKPTKAPLPVKIKPNAALYPPRQRLVKSTTVTTSTEAPFSSTTEVVSSKRPTLRTRHFRPTERSKVNIGSTLQEPPTAKFTPTYATRAPVNQITEEESMNVNTQITDDAIKQIDPPINEQYFPRTSAIGSSSGLRFSSRFRNSDVTSKPGYQPTVPIVTTTPGLDLNDIDLERWREILPLAAELIHGDASEIMTQSPSQTVSIYEALAEILSKPTESLNLFNNKSTDRTNFTEAPISSTSTTTTTSTTTSSTTSKYDDTKVEYRVNRSKDTPVNIQATKIHSQKSPNSHDTTTLNMSDLLMSFDESTNYLTWSKFFDTNNETNGTHDKTKLDLMTRRVWNGDLTSSTFYPVYVPMKTDKIPSTSPLPMTTKNHRLVYTVLPNNTIEKKILRQHKGREDIIYSRLNNGTVVRKFPNGTQVPDDVYFEMTSLNPVRHNHESATPTENIQTENAGIIIDLLQKYQNESDTHVKSPNIFSLAKKSHHGGELENDTEINQINDQNEVTLRPSASTSVSITSKLPSTHSTVGLNSVSIYPNGYDTTSTEQPETTKDSFENEIGLDDLDFKLPSTKFTTRVTSSSSSSSTRSLPMTTTTLKPIVSTTIFSTTRLPDTTTTQTRVSSTKSFIRTTTENFIDKNFKVLQDLLSKPTITPFANDATIMSTTEIPSTTTRNFIDKNFQALQDLLNKKEATPFSKPTTRNQVTTTEMPTTQNFIDRNSEILKSLLSRSRATPFSKATTLNQIKTTEIPVTTEFEELSLSIFSSTTTTLRPTSSVQKIKRPSTQVRHTTVSFTPSSTTTKIPLPSSTEKVTTISTTQTPSSTRRLIPSSTSTEAPTTLKPPSSTHRFVPIKIPSDLPSTIFTSTTKGKAPFSDAEDVEFLRQLSSFVNRGPSTTPMTPPRRTTTTTTERATTQKSSTFSDSEDLAFLNSLRNYASLINLTTERSNLANKILELAVNRMSKSVGDSKSSSNNKLESVRPAPFATTQSPESVMNKIMDMKENINLMSSVILENQKNSPQMRLSQQEVEKTKKMLQKDVMQYNNDIQLLSLLIGRPLNEKDLEKLAKTNLGKVSSTSTPRVTIPSTSRVTIPSTQQSTSSSITIPAFKALSTDERKFLEALQQIQTTQMTSTTTTTQRTVPTRSRSQEAIIAALLKQQGIGPSINGNNQVQLDKILEQLSTDRSNRGIAAFSTTIRPFVPMPPLQRQPRPIVDGLSWLWRTWQETAPGYQAPRQRPQVQQQQSSLSFNDDFGTDQESQSGNAGGLIYPSSQSPLGPNGFIGAAIGVTRAVTQFLGVAFQGAGRFLQVALSTGSAASNIQGFNQGFGDSRL